MRGLDGVSSAEQMIAGLQTYYNYIREHSALGKTPTLEAGIDLNLGVNRWESIVALIANQKQFGGA